MIIQELMKNYPEQNEDEVMSLFMFMAQLPYEIIVLDIESSSKTAFHLISKLFQDNFYTNYLNIINNLKEKNCVNLTSQNGTKFKLHVRDKFIFQILLFTSLKYRKSLFTQGDLNNVTFLQNVLKNIIESISLVRPQSLQILKLIEIVLKKREDILTGDLSMLILKSMNKVASSPLIGFKHCALSINRIVIKSLPHNIKTNLCNFDNFPIKSIDLNDILKLFDVKQLHSLNYKINNQILKLFRSNTESRDGCFYYDSLIATFSFDEFVKNVWPFYYTSLEDFEDDGEFYQSFLKYWIPVTVNHYKDKFYTFIKDSKVDFRFKAYTLLEVKKRGFYDKSFDSDALIFLKFSKTTDLALTIFTTYIKKCTFPDKFEIEAVRYYLSSFRKCEFSDDNLKCLKRLISQIFLIGHIRLKKSDNLDLYQEFLGFTYEFCLVRIDGECNEMAAQLLKITWDIAGGSSSDLTTLYKIDKENTYEIGNNSYFQYLIDIKFWQNTFTNCTLLDKINVFLGKNLCCPSLIELVIERYIKIINLENFRNFPTLLEDLHKSVCLKTSETVRIYSNLMMSVKIVKNLNYNDDVANLLEIFNERIIDNHLFDCVLILDIFLSINKYADVDLIILIENCFDFFEKYFENNPGSNLDVKSTKILEAFINNTIECLMVSKNHWQNFHKNKILSQLCHIIKKSNMKKPVSISINAVRYFGTLMEQNDEDRQIKIKLLDRTLLSLYENKENSKIRRNPETRLVIHALCLTDKNPTKPYLTWSLNFMLKILANPQSSDSTLSSTLHSLEVLVSDNLIHQLTLPFIPEIITHCIRLFNNTNWIVRNADLQLLKSLIERFLGVLLDYNTRPKTIEDLFVLFPTLSEYFFKILSLPTLDNSALIVLLFFSESQIKNNIFLELSLGDTFELFRHLFIDIIKNNSNNFSFLAIKAFTALCIDDKIPEVFAEIVDYIKQNSIQTKANVFASLIKLLQELYHKYELSLGRMNSNIIVAIDDLIIYLRRFHCFYFNLLLLKLDPIKVIIHKIIKYVNSEIDYEKRIWLNNYLPYAIMQIDISKLGSFLYHILSARIPDFLQIQILSVLVDRFDTNSNALIEVINILICQITKLCDFDKFLIMSYAKSILLFYEISNGLDLSNDLIAEIRQDYDTDNIYKILIYVLALAHIENKIDIDNIFLNRSIGKYIEALGEDNEILLDLSTSIRHLYKSSPIQNRFNIMKLTFYLLIYDSTSFEMCKFISLLTGSQCSSVLHAAVKFLNFENLSTYVGDKQLTLKLLSEFYWYVDGLPNECEVSQTYYLIENDFSLPIQYIRKIIIKSLYDSSVFYF